MGRLLERGDREAELCWSVADFAGGLTSRRLPAAVVLLGQQVAGALICAAIVVATAERAHDLAVAAGRQRGGARGALYPVATVLLARAMLGERLRREQQAGVVLAFAGVAAVAAG